ncbi:MAG: alpha/beta hydrolase-fold protein [Bacteroidota bacterium]
MKSGIISLAFLFISLPIFSQQIDSIPYFSTHLGEERLLTIWKPADYSPEEKYSTIYTFDAEWMFGLLTGMVAYYSGEGVEKIPPSIVIGIHFKDRNEDMGIGWDKEGLDEQGQKFKSYVEKELIPYVESHYSTSGFSSIFGHSNSSTFLNYFLFQEDPTFTAYAPISQYLLPTDSSEIAKWLPKHRQDKSLYYFLTSAEKDAPFRLQSGIDHERLFGKLAPKISFEHLILPRADHLTMAAQAIPFALEGLYKDFQHMDESKATAIARAADEKAIPFVDRELERVGKIFGLQMKWNINDYFFAYEMASVQRDETSVAEITQKYNRENPDDKSMYFIEGQVYESMESLQKAKESYLRNLQINVDAGYFSHFRLIDILDRKLKEAALAIEVAEMGIAKEIDIQLHYQLAKVAAKHQIKMELGLKHLHIFEEKYDSSIGIEREYIHLRKGQLLEALGQKSQAREEFEKALQLNPEFELAKSALGNLGY